MLGERATEGPALRAPILPRISTGEMCGIIMQIPYER